MYTAAIAFSIGDVSPNVRLGGIYTWQRIAEDCSAACRRREVAC